MSASLAVTYDNTFANYDSDFFPSVNNAALAANHFFHVTYVAPITDRSTSSTTRRTGSTSSATMPYESGYRYGVGKKVYIFQNVNGAGAGVRPEHRFGPNGLRQDAYYFTDPTNPGTDLQSEHHRVARHAGRATIPGTLKGPQIATVQVEGVARPRTSAAQHAGGCAGAKPFRQLHADAHTSQLVLCSQWARGYGPGSGVNVNACPPGVNFACEPFQYNQSAFPYENESSGPPRLFTFFLSMKY